jgi:hypothetical protein
MLLQRSAQLPHSLNSAIYGSSSKKNSEDAGYHSLRACNNPGKFNINNSGFYNWEIRRAQHLAETNSYRDMYIKPIPDARTLHGSSSKKL